jgi:hypothetical protein
MADDLSFTISAQDQASRSIETVQKKIQGFGSDVAKLALGVVGPMALLQAGIGYVTEKWQEYKQAQQEAFDKGASATYEEVKAQEGLGVQLDKNLSVLLAMAKVKAENAKNVEDVKAQEDQAIEAFKNTPEGRAFTQAKTQRIMAGQGTITVGPSREDYLKAASELGATIRAALEASIQGPIITPEQQARIDEENKFNEEDKKRRASGALQNEQIGNFIKRFTAETAMPKQKTKEETKQDLVLTVSSLREIGGSFGGGDVATGIEKQITLAEKQLDTLTEIKDALNRGSQESQVFPEGLRTTMETTA